MHGHFEVQLRDARGRSDRDLLLSGRQGQLDAMLAAMPVVQRCAGSNLINDNLAAFLFNKLMSGPDIADPYDFDLGSAALATLLLSSADAEPVYTEESNQWSNVSSTWDTVEWTTAGKRFVEDAVEATLIQSDPTGREAIECRSRFLYLPSQAVSNNIRSISVFFCEDADATWDRTRGIIARIRLKDSGGNPIVINKTSAQVLLIEYTLSLVAV